MKSLLLFSLSILLISSCTPPAEPDPGPVISAEVSQAVFDHHINAVLANDLDAILEDYSEESILFTPDSTYTGLTQIRGFFEGLLPSFPTEGTNIEVDRLAVEQDAVFILWHGSTPTLDIPFGTDTFIIQDSIIILQSFAGVINPVEKEAEEE